MKRLWDTQDPMFVAAPPQIMQPDASAYVHLLDMGGPLALAGTPLEIATIPQVPFYSQFADITSPKWKKVGCGIASLAMLIEYYEPQDISVDKLLNEGIAAGAYLNNAGWTYKGLIDVSRDHGMDGSFQDLGKSSMDTAYAALKEQLEAGPVMASIHYEFDPKSTIPHLVVITGIEDGLVYYNDPASNAGDESISVEKFKKAWKKRFIVIRPASRAQNA